MIAVHIAIGGACTISINTATSQHATLEERTNDRCNNNASDHQY
jgi:uncharacterized protein YcgI (DUF1989 family)